MIQNFNYDHSLDCVDLQKSIDIVNIWTKKFLLFLNVDKCKILHIGSKKYQDNKTIYYLDSSAIQPLDVEKDLGVLVNFNLNWNQHITKICLNANYWRKMLHKCFIFK